MRLRVWMGAVLGLIVVALALGVVAPSADAKTSLDSPYSLEQTFHAALRLLRVDLRLKILERDLQAGYLLFDYQSPESGSRTVPGSIEMVDAGRAITVLVQIPAMPRYHEQVLIDRLARKLREEYGEPLRKGGRTGADAGTGGAAPVPAD